MQSTAQNFHVRIDKSFTFLFFSPQLEHNWELGKLAPTTLNCLPYHLHLYSSILRNSDHDTSEIALAKYGFLTYFSHEGFRCKWLGFRSQATLKICAKNHFVGWQFFREYELLFSFVCTNLNCRIFSWKELVELLLVFLLLFGAILDFNFGSIWKVANSFNPTWCLLRRRKVA